MAIILSLVSIFPISIPSDHSFAAVPSYAKVGSYAFYSGNGGYASFLGGVSSNITYSVLDVFPNNSMVVFVNTTISQGLLSDVPPSTVLKNFSDSIDSPKILPAIPLQNLTNHEIFFQNITCVFVKNALLTVPAGNFNATEFQGKDTNGTTLTFWFDRSTGLALQMSQDISYLQLVQTNIATPLKTQTSLEAEIPFISVFVVAWSITGLVFYAVWRHYTHRDKKGTRLKKGQEQRLNGKGVPKAQPATRDSKKSRKS